MSPGYFKVKNLLAAFYPSGCEVTKRWMSGLYAQCNPDRIERNHFGEIRFYLQAWPTETGGVSISPHSCFSLLLGFFIGFAVALKRVSIVLFGGIRTFNRREPIH